MTIFTVGTIFFRRGLAGVSVGVVVVGDVLGIPGCSLGFVLGSGFWSLDLGARGLDQIGVIATDRAGTWCDLCGALSFLFPLR